MNVDHPLCFSYLFIVVLVLCSFSSLLIPPVKMPQLILFVQARNAMKSFASPDGDHLTLINVYRASDEFLEKRKMEISKEKTEKILRKWCKDNFINSRSLRHARDIHRYHSLFASSRYI